MLRSMAVPSGEVTFPFNFASLPNKIGTFEAKFSPQEQILSFKSKPQFERALYQELQTMSFKNMFSFLNTVKNMAL